MNLRLLQISDSALPIGGYMHSWGLEAAIARGLVRDAPTLERWTRDWLRFGLGPLEGVVAACCYRAVHAGDWGEVGRAGELLAASLAPPTVRAASLQMGEQLAALAATWAWSAAGAGRLEGCLPTARRHHAAVFGALGPLAGASAADTLAAYLHQAALGMISSGVRGVPVGHTHGQQVLAYLHPDVEALAEELAGRDLDAAGAGCPFYEVLCDEQARLFTRVFRS
jgi:urease accessory protein